MIAYLLGIIGVAFAPSLSWAWWGVLVGLLFACLKPLRKMALLFACGGLIASLYGHWQLAHRFELPPRDVELAAEVVGLPDYRAGQYSLLLRPSHTSTLPSAVRPLRLIKASYYGNDHSFAVGDQLQLIVRLKSPQGLSNPAAFDLERYYLSQGIDARGYIRQVIDQHSAAPSLMQARQYLADWFDQIFSETGSVTLRALVLGDRSRLTSAQWDTLRVTGTAHLFVVSGLHVAIIAALGWWLGRLLQLPALMLRLQGSCLRMLPGLIALCIAGVYAWMSGWGIPVQRAWLMLAVFIAGGWLLQPLSGWQRWRMALLVIVSLHPLSVLEAGLWLSFAAVALILWLWQCSAQPGGIAGKLGFGVKLQLVLFIGMMPLMVSLFNQFSLLSVPVNLVAVPLLTLLLWFLPALLMVCMFSGDIVLLVDESIAGIWGLLSWCAEVPGLHTEVSVSFGYLVLLALAAVLLLLPMPMLQRFMIFPMLAPVLSAQNPQLDEGAFTAWIFDVGQGQAVLIETAGGALLYDTGPGYPGGGAAFPFAIQPLLDMQGIRHLDALVVSHGDSDHAGGYDALSNNLTVGRFYAGEPTPLPGAVQCSQQQWQWGGVLFRFQRAFVQRPDTLSSNNRSCVLRVENDRCSLLLTGDLDASGEYRLLSGGYRLPVTWLVAGHHGSRDSTTGALLDWLQPDKVLISAGRNNRFGHPHAAVVSRLGVRGIPWMQTAEAGAIKLVADSEHCSAEAYRRTKKRYWTAS
ncbi:DNA internalization-related competence protein ComEC/Rec2 [Marinobacterium maritimum]|uniref:DNA internalization-related competence protein ComEC/Rec2 n=1 Tax=Marinobacterium maritimum TaxID=500162 RepID=A0ABP3T9U2_9GAMM